LGSVTHESYDGEEVTQSIVALSVSIHRSLEGIHLRIENTLWPPKIRILGKTVVSGQLADTTTPAAVTNINVDVLLPTALLIARDLLPRFLRSRILG
jgi:hypothetical protein